MMIFSISVFDMRVVMVSSGNAKVVSGK
jgi:hypothetical protein